MGADCCSPSSKQERRNFIQRASVWSLLFIMSAISSQSFKFLYLLGLLLLLSGCSASQNRADLLRLRQLQNQAYNGQTKSQYQLGIHYTTKGQGPLDMARGYGWFLEAAESGHIDAQYMVGMANILGRGTSQNTDTAIVWLRRAAKQGHARSQYQLAQIYLNGRGVDVDILWGRYWLEQAAWSNHPDAQFLLSALFRKGIGGSIHRPEALVWLNRAAQNGHEEAQKALPKLTHELSKKEQRQAKDIDLQNKIKRQNLLLEIPKVRYIQAALNLKGFPAGIDDGILGIKTRQAIDMFLQKNKLPRDTAIDQLLLYLRGIK